MPVQLLARWKDILVADWEKEEELMFDSTIVPAFVQMK
jgi:hypothetical protein